MTKLELELATLQPGDALLVVDLQNDFLPSGSLPVPESDQLIPLINGCLRQFAAHGCPIFASRDWHPADHCSFTQQGGTWPIHCLHDTAGAEFAAGLDLPLQVIVVSKGDRRDAEAYSAFDGTDLASKLRGRQVRRLFVCGVATEYCVRETARDALQNGFDVVLLADAVRAVDQAAGYDAIAELVRMGAVVRHILTRDKSPSDRSPSDRSPAERPRAGATSAMLTDLYQLTMLQTYFERQMNAEAVFEFFVRELPEGRNFLLAAGLEQALVYLETLHFTPDELEWLASCGRFRPEFVDYLADLRFTGEVHAMPEGTVFFAHEPILRVTASMPEAQLVESRLINLLQFQTLIASKASRCVLAAPGSLLVDFGMRRAHGAEAGLLAARAAYLAGFAGSSTVLAGEQFDIPMYGTMAHSLIQAHDDETEALENFARTNPGSVVLLLDTYDTEAAARKTVDLARRLEADGIHIKGVRLDSGDLAEHARRVRRILNAGGLRDVTIFASGGLDESRLQALLAAGAPIDGFGIGSRLDVSADVPCLDCAYKLQEYAGRPRRKRSEGKATWPGRKQVYRQCVDGVMTGDVVTLADDPQPGQPLLQPVMAAGERLGPARPLHEIRQAAEASLDCLPESLRQLTDAPAYPVKISPALRDLAELLDRR